SSYIINRTTSIEAALEAARDQIKYFAPTSIDIFLATALSEADMIDWVLHYEAGNPRAAGEAILENAPKLAERQMIEAGAYFLDNIATSTTGSIEHIRRIPGWERLTAQASVPLSVKGRATGRLVLGFNRPYTFERFERQFITTLADQLAIVIDN